MGKRGRVRLFFLLLSAVAAGWLVREAQLLREPETVAGCCWPPRSGFRASWTGRTWLPGTGPISWTMRGRAFGVCGILPPATPSPWPLGPTAAGL